jgi:hypothetical protein
MRGISLAITLALLATAGCSKAKDEPANDRHQGMAMDSSMMEGMAGMGRTSRMPAMQAHLDSMMRMGADQMSSMMPRHERMMSEMMDRMGAEMRQMQMTKSREWSALADSVRQDLAELPSLKGPALSTRMRAHAARARRLLTSHEQMMKEMR